MTIEIKMVEPDLVARKELGSHWLLQSALFCGNKPNGEYLGGFDSIRLARLMASDYKSPLNFLAPITPATPGEQLNPLAVSPPGILKG